MDRFISDIYVYFRALITYDYNQAPLSNEKKPPRFDLKKKKQKRNELINKSDGSGVYKLSGS